MKSKRLKYLLSAALMVAGQLSAFADGIKRDISDIQIPKIQSEWMAALGPKGRFQSEVMKELEPTYTNDVLVGSPWTRNWFVSASAGTSAFIGTPLGCEDLFGRMQPALQVTAGKWFTPAIGVRVGYQGFKFTDANITDHDYHHAHADLMWNVVGMNRKDELGLHRWTVAPFIGGGIIHHEDNGKVPFALDFGVMAAYRFNPRLSVNMELRGLNTLQDFDGQGNFQRFGDQMYTISAGVTINIGEVGWKRAVDAHPYRVQNEYLKDYINDLLEKHKNGLSDSMLIARNIGKHGDYSGLASLRARLATNGKDGLADGDGSLNNAADSLTGQSSESRKLIGVPYYLFFKINTAQLTDESQLQNLANLAKVAKAYKLQIYVDGAADAATGNEAINASLSQARANYIAGLLHDYGVADNTIHIRANGGIDKFSPIERNRHTRVMIKK